MCSYNVSYHLAEKECSELQRCMQVKLTVGACTVFSLAYLPLNVTDLWISKFVTFLLTILPPSLKKVFIHGPNTPLFRSHLRIVKCKEKNKEKRKLPVHKLQPVKQGDFWVAENGSVPDGLSPFSVAPYAPPVGKERVASWGHKKTTFCSFCSLAKHLPWLNLYT